MNDFIQILEELEKESSTNRKIEILKENKDNVELRFLLQQALSKDITFGIATIEKMDLSSDKYNQIIFFPYKRFEWLCRSLNARAITGNEAREQIWYLLFYCNELEKKWFSKVLLKDLSSIGLGQSLIDKAFETQTKFKLGLACEVEELDKIDDDQDGWCDLKYNGYRTTVYIRDGKVDIIYSGRSGIEAENFYFIKDELEKLISSLVSNISKEYLNYVLDGEIHIGHDNHLVTSLYGFKYRSKEGFIGKKGLKEKAWSDYQTREKEVLELKSRAKFAIFDIIPMENWEAQSYDKELKDRKQDLAIIGKTIVDLGLEQIEIAKSKYCPNKAEGIKCAQEYIDDDFEGGIWKVSNGCYQWKRWRTWIKIKRDTTFEIQLKRFIIQKPKYNSDGTLKPDMVGKVIGIDKYNNEHEVGTGVALDEKTRIDMFNNWSEYEDTIWECSAQEPSKASQKYINPRLDIRRLDRNSLED